METDDDEMGTVEDSHSTNTTSSTTPASSVSNQPVAASSSSDPAIVKRRAIQAIMRGSTLSDLEKRLRIQQLMDGRPNTGNHVSNGGSIQSDRNSSISSIGGFGGSMSDGDVSPATHAVETSNTCAHYQRNCAIVAPCCNQIFGCHVCHDEITAAAAAGMPNVVHDNSTGVAAAAADHERVDRFGIREIVCKQCHTRQDSKR